MSTDERLVALGWRHGDITDARHFQAAYNLGAPLVVDGIIGPLTSHALSTSLARLHANQPTASAHFSFTEFQCQCGGRFADCARVIVLRQLITSLEVLRGDFYPHGLTVVSGYRCPQHNAAVSGESDSQHMYGSAADLAGVAPADTVAGMHLFAGIGRGEHDGKCHHVDRRDVSGVNNGGTLAVPIQWSYPWA